MLTRIKNLFSAVTPEPSKPLRFEQGRINSSLSEPLCCSVVPFRYSSGVRGRPLNLLPIRAMRVHPPPSVVISQEAEKAETESPVLCGKSSQYFPEADSGNVSRILLQDIPERTSDDPSAASSQSFPFQPPEHLQAHLDLRKIPPFLHSRGASQDSAHWHRDRSKTWPGSHFFDAAAGQTSQCVPVQNVCGCALPRCEEELARLHSQLQDFAF